MTWTAFAILAMFCIKKGRKKYLCTWVLFDFLTNSLCEHARHSDEMPICCLHLDSINLSPVPGWARQGGARGKVPQTNHYWSAVQHPVKSLPSSQSCILFCQLLGKEGDLSQAALRISNNVVMWSYSSPGQILHLTMKDFVKDGKWHIAKMHFRYRGFHFLQKI